MLIRWRRALFALLFIGSWLAFNTLPLMPKAEAANFSMQTGAYMGTGASKAITGLGFQPSTVMIKSATTAGVAVFKTSSMAANTTAFLSATADNTGTNIALDADGFTVGTLANVNTANVLYHWIAFTGSDCSASGNYCVGSYTGNNSSPRTIATGFQPTFVMVKRSTAVAGHFRTASMTANHTHFFVSTAGDTAGNYVQSFAANGFTVGATDNANSATYYYVAFKTTASTMTEGTYAGTGGDNVDITAPNFRPNFVLTKNATSATANNRRAIMTTTDHNGDLTSYMGDAVASAANGIQGMISTGFQLGTLVNANESSATFYYAAFGGAATPGSASGTFSMDTGSYTGTGSSFSVTGLSFRPDLVIIKDSAATNYAVFRTSMMHGDSTAYISNALGNFTGGITSINSDGFTIGTSTVTNNPSANYHWQALGGAYNPYTHSGAADFAVGAYYAGGTDSQNITRVPWQPDMVAIKRNGATAGTWRSSALSGDSSSFFGATGETVNSVQALNSDGFQIGNSANVNTGASVYYWFAFKEGSNFDVGSYSGTGSTQNITGPGFQPELVWVKRSTNVNGVMRGGSVGGTNSQYFANAADVSDRITALISTGFSVGGSQTESNTNGGTYRYAAWKPPTVGTLTTDIVDSGGSSVSSPSVSFTALASGDQCQTSTGTLGASSEKVRVNNDTANPAWTLSIAATSGATSNWSSGTATYDFNDPTSSGCGDGGDADSLKGQLSIDPSGATNTPEGGCNTTGISLGSSSSYNQGTTDSITLASASGSTGTGCYWDLTDIDLSQKVPEFQAAGSYSINMTITVTAN